MYGPYVRLPRPDWPYLGAVRTVRAYGRYVRAVRTANVDGQPYVRAVRTAVRTAVKNDRRVACTARTCG